MLVRISRNCRLRPICFRWKSDCNITDSKENQKNEPEKTEVTLPVEPTYCCMSGCANCVWIKYAQELTQLFDDGDEIARKKISEKVQDPKLRAFLFTQLGLESLLDTGLPQLQKAKPKRRRDKVSTSFKLLEILDKRNAFTLAS